MKYKRLVGVYFAFAALLLAVVVGIATSKAPAAVSTPSPVIVVDHIQTIYVRNLSTFVSDAQVVNDMPAFQAATTKDFAPIWKTDAKLIFIGKKKAPRRGSIVINLLDKSDVQGALAYHTVVDGVPLARIFIGTSRYYGYSWTNGFTHELFEMLADPNLVSTVQGFSKIIWAQEVSDPCESDSQGYSRPGLDGKPVLISDFVTPNWFGAEVDGPYDFMHHIQEPEKILIGGYAQYWDGFHWIQILNFRKAGLGHAVHF